MLCLHRERHVFPASVYVTKASGEGMDSVFMGVFKVRPEKTRLITHRDLTDDSAPPSCSTQPVPDEKLCIRAFCTPGGVILCCDLRFLDWFGINPVEVGGKMFHSLAVESGTLESLVGLASETNEAELNNGVVGALGPPSRHFGKFRTLMQPS